MAYLLRAQNGQYITLPSGLVIGSNDDFSIKVVAEPSQNSDFYRPLGGSDFNDSAPRILIFGGGRSRITTGGGTNLEWFPSFDISAIKEIKFRRISGTLEYLVDGVVISGWTRTGDTSSFDEFSVINANFGATTAYQCDYKLIEFEVNGVVTNRYDPSASGGTGSTLIDTVSGNNGTLVNFPTDDSQWVFFDDGGSEPEPELHEFSGNAVVNALSHSQATKITQHNGLALVNVSASGQFAKSVTLSSDSLVTASATASSNKVINISGGATVVTQSVSLFEKRNTFSGNATVNATSQSSASKRVTFDGQATVNVITSASIIDGNFEIHSFSGGALITASASGQAVKIGLVSGSANVTTSTSAQASKTAQLSGNATISASAQSLFSKIASISGNAKTRVTTLASAFKRVTLSGASRVFASAYGTLFNTESNVETYELTVQGRVKAPIVVQGTIKSLTIQGRVK